jgi:hypothetical protein
MSRKAGAPVSGDATRPHANKGRRSGYEYLINFEEAAA